MNKKISASRILLAFCMVLSMISTVIAEEIENEEGSQLIEENEDYFDYWSEPQELMSVEEFQAYYNGEVSDKTRSQLVRVKKLAEYDNGVHWLSMMSIDGQVVFCLDPTVAAGLGMEYNQSNDWNYLGWETQWRIWKVVRFGYQQYGSDDYYIASQILIWRELGYWITPNVNVDSQINQIEANINSFGTPPSFHNQTLELEFQVGKTITDTNGVLNKYNVGCPNGVSCSKNGNDLTVIIEDLNFDKNGKIDISSPGTNDPSWIGVVWTLPGAQTVASIGYSDPRSSYALNIKMSTGNLEIIKVDEYGLAAGSGHQFEVAFDEEFNDVIGTYSTDEDGEILIEDTLPAGTYYVREVETVNGYVINPGIYEVEIALNETTEISIMNNLQQVDLQYFKIDEEWNEILLDGAVFSVTDITEAEEVQAVDEDGNLLWEDEEETIPLMDIDGDIYEFDVITGNQYIRVYDLVDNSQAYQGKIEISINENFEEVMEIETDENGLVILNELDLSALGQVAPEGESQSYFYRVLDDASSLKSPIGTFTLLSEEELVGWANMPLKHGRTYEVCEVNAPDGYDLPEEACKVVSMDLGEGVSFSTDTLSNKRRRLALKLYKQNESQTILLSGAAFTIEKIYKDYEVERMRGELTEDELESWEEPTTEFIGEYITGALILQGELGEQYRVSLDTEDEVEVSYLYTLGESGELIKYLPDGKYIVERVSTEEESGELVLDPTFESYETYVSQGTIYSPDLIYGHEYRICETRAPGGYFIEGDGCSIVIPEADYGIEIFNNYRINQIIKIPVMRGE
ncbi:MAG: collagen binding domain-containing protein [Anaerorhabdus sp.]